MWSTSFLILHFRRWCDWESEVEDVSGAYGTYFCQDLRWDFLICGPELPILISNRLNTNTHQTSLLIYGGFFQDSKSAFYIPGHSSGDPLRWSLPQWTSLVKQTGPGQAWRCGPETQGEWWAALARLHSGYGTEAKNRDKIQSIYTYINLE